MLQRNARHSRKSHVLQGPVINNIASRTWSMISGASGAPSGCDMSLLWMSGAHSLKGTLISSSQRRREDGMRPCVQGRCCWCPPERLISFAPTEHSPDTTWRKWPSESSRVPQLSLRGESSPRIVAGQSAVAFHPTFTSLSLLNLCSESASDFHLPHEKRASISRLRAVSQEK